MLYYHTVSSDQRERFARQLDILIRHAEVIRTDFATPLPNGRSFVCITFDDGMVSFAETALPELEKRGIPSTVFVVTGKLGQSPNWANFSDEPLTTEPTMTAAQLKEISHRVLIGSHTTTHPMLTSLNEAAARCELEQSRNSLKGLLNEEITQFSFPYGDFNEALLKWSREAGYQRVFTNQPVPFVSGGDASVVGRVTVEPTDWESEFRLKISGAYQWRPLAVALKRNLLHFFRKNKGPRIAHDIGKEHGHSCAKEVIVGKE